MPSKSPIAGRYGGNIPKMPKVSAKPPKAAKAKPVAMPMGDNRAGRLHSVATDRGAFRFKDNRKGC